MDLIIYTAAKDKSLAAVQGITTTTPVSQLEDLVLGDQPLFNIVFTDGTAVAPSFAGNPDYVLSVGIGIPDVNGQSNKATSSTFTPITAGWSGRISLNTTLLRNALALVVGNAVTWTQFPLYARTPRPMPYGGYFILQIRVTDPQGYATTYAELRVFVRNRVLPDSSGTDTDETEAFYAWIRANAVLNASLLGIGSNVGDDSYLCGIATSGGQMPVGAKILASFPGDIQVLFELVATAAVSPGWLFQPFDYSAASPFKWKLRQVFYLGSPCFPNVGTGLWHENSAVGDDGSAVASMNPTGFALPS